jgi:ABC-type multidrug transport system fused ATPase/permease subunit
VVWCLRNQLGHRCRPADRRSENLSRNVHTAGNGYFLACPGNEIPYIQNRSACSALGTIHNDFPVPHSRDYRTNVQISGVVIALAVFDWRISLTCLTLVLPLLFINKIYTRRVSTLQRDAHDTFENAYDVFSTQKPEEIHDYYIKSAGIKQQIAHGGALNFGVKRGILLFIFLAVLYIAVDLDDFTTGSIYSIVTYIWTFITSSEFLPELMESWTSLKDVSNRFKEASL